MHRVSIQILERNDTAKYNNYSLQITTRLVWGIAGEDNKMSNERVCFRKPDMKLEQRNILEYLQYSVLRISHILMKLS